MHLVRVCAHVRCVCAPTWRTVSVAHCISLQAAPPHPGAHTHSPPRVHTPFSQAAQDGTHACDTCHSDDVHDEGEQGCFCVLVGRQSCIKITKVREATESAKTGTLEAEQ